MAVTLGAKIHKHARRLPPRVSNLPTCPIDVVPSRGRNVRMARPVARFAPDPQLTHHKIPLRRIQPRAGRMTGKAPKRLVSYEAMSHDFVRAQRSHLRSARSEIQTARIGVVADAAFEVFTAVQFRDESNSLYA